MLLKTDAYRLVVFFDAVSLLQSWIFNYLKKYLLHFAKLIQIWLREQHQQLEKNEAFNYKSKDSHSHTCYLSLFLGDGDRDVFIKQVKQMEATYIYTLITI